MELKSMKRRLVKSKDRVAQHGEVFTGEREINAMLDLVKDETLRIESRFLEPACGEGYFLMEILRRKLNVVQQRYSKSKSEYEKYSILALSSIYGVELLEDNTDVCRKNLFNIWNDYYTKNFMDIDQDVLKSAKYVLKKNICCGDALTMLTNDGTPIVFSQWDLVCDDNIKRKDYRLDILLQTESDNSEKYYQMSFEDLTLEWEYEDGRYIKLPQILKDYPLSKYWRLFENE